MNHHPSIRSVFLLPLLFVGLMNTALAASLSPSSQTVSGVAGQAITSTKAYAATGFTGTIVYTISPNLPANLNINPNTGVISGIPASPLASTQFTVTAKGATSGKATAGVKITIAAPPAAISPASQSITTNRDTAINPTAAFTASNFGGTVSYTVSPALPSGLNLDGATGVISGTPKLPQPATSYTITAKGSTSGSAKATVAISVIENCMTETLSSAQEGRRAYLRLNCYSCHGTNGKGGMGPKIVGKEYGDVQEAMMYGKDEGMPPYKNYVCGNDITNIAAYLASIGKSSEPKFLHWWEQTPTQ